jgi:cholinesterase
MLKLSPLCMNIINAQYQPVLIGITEDEGGMAAYAATLGGRSAQSAMEAGTNCPPARAVEARAQQKLPAWRYRLMAAYPNTGKSAVHGADLPLIFGTMDTGRPNQPKSTEEELKLSKNIRTAWATFAKDPNQGLTKLGWPVYQADKPTLVLLGENNKAETKFVDPAPFDSGCSAFWNGGKSAAPKTSG